MRAPTVLALLASLWAAIPACSSASAPGVRCVKNDTLCACDDLVAETNDVACTKETFPSGECCAYDGWPAKNSTCTCASIACRTSSNGACVCQLDVAGASGIASCAAPVGGACCIDAASSSCFCSKDACTAPDTPVPDCTPVRITGCAPGNHVVASCR